MSRLALSGSVDRLICHKHITFCASCQEGFFAGPSRSRGRIRSYALCPRRNNPTLRGSGLTRKESSTVDVTGLEPLLENPLVHRDVGHQPVVTDRIEIPLDIEFENPSWRASPGQRRKALFDGIGGGSLGSKTIGVLVRGNLGDGHESHQMQGLHGPILHGWNPQRTKRAVAFRNIDSPQRKGFVATPCQRFHRLLSVFRCLPNDSVDARCVSSLIRHHPDHCQNFRSVRVGQQSLKVFDQPPLAFSGCLRDAELKSSDPFSKPVPACRVQRGVNLLGHH